MNLQDHSQDVLLTMCGWCHRIIGENEEHLARGAKAWPEARGLFRAKEGQVVVLVLAGQDHQILGIVPRSDSPAVKDGYDVIFQTCSDRCADALDERIRTELGKTRPTHAEKVSFIMTETGDDLILSFVVQRSDDPADIKSLILMRTPKYEFLLEEHERGVSVSFERYADDEEDLLQRVEYLEAEAIVRVLTSSRQHVLDVRRVDATELQKMRKILKKMNYDQKFQASGV